MSYDTRPLLVPLVVIFVVSIGIAAISPIASVAVFFGASYAVLGYGLAQERKQLRDPRPQLPEARVIDNRDADEP